MKEIFINFFDKRDKRKIQMFFFIKSQGTKGIKFNELILVQQVSRKTVSADFKELNHDIQDIYGHEYLIKRESTIFIDWSPLNDVNLLLFYYFKRSRSFKVMHAQLTNPNLSQNQLNSKIFWSSTALYTVYNNLSLLFKPLDIMFDFKGIAGEERIIRHLLVELYWAVFSKEGWPFEIDKIQLKEKIDLFKNNNYFDFEMAEEKSIYWLAITIFRLQGGYLISSNKENNEDSSYWVLNELCKDYIKSETKINIIDLVEESKFLKKTLEIILRKPEISIQQDLKYPILKYQQIELSLLQRGKEQKVPFFMYQWLELELVKIRYYIEEDLLKLYHFFKPEAKKIWKGIQPMLNLEIRKVMEDMPSSIESAYIYAGYQVGLILMNPVRVQINAKEEELIKVANALFRYSRYPVVVVGSNEKAELTLVDVSYINQSKDKNNDGIMFFYECPLTEEQVEKGVSKVVLQKIINSDIKEITIKEDP